MSIKFVFNVEVHAEVAGIIAVATSDFGGGCPILHVYDGSEYVYEGLLDIHNLKA